MLPNFRQVRSPCSRRSASVERTLCTLSAQATRSTGSGAVCMRSMYACFRPSQGGFGCWSVSLQASTMSATAAEPVAQLVQAGAVALILDRIVQ